MTRGPFACHRRIAEWLAALCVGTVVLAAADIPAAAARGQAGSLVYAQHPCTAVLDAPSTAGRLVTQLLGGSELTLVADQSAADGTGWAHVKLWSGLDAFVADADIKALPPSRPEEGVCAFPGLPDALADPLAPSPGPWPVVAHGVISVPLTLMNAPDAAAFPLVAVPIDRGVTITAWAADTGGRPWYHLVTADVTGWAPAAAIQLDQPDPATRLVGGVPISQLVAGKGMWFTNYLPHHSDVGAMVRAAKLAGLTHVYAEVATSTYGFYGRGTLDRLLPAAHAAGLNVIAWVYPYLNDVATDVRLTQEVAAYRSSTGDHVDGLATDVEETTTEEAVYSYGQLVRALVGPDMLLVAAVLHPLTHAGYPYDAIAANWNVVAPMDYWHGRQHHEYSAAATSRFVATSLTTVRAAVGARLPIEELGQAYDMYTDDGAGGSDAPSPVEMAADLQTARRLGCVGASYFEWQTTTQAEWQAITSAVW
jgi:hypothetical protein